MIKVIVITVCLVVAITLAACQASTPVPVPTEIPLPTQTTAPTSTPMPTYTPVPTDTPVPTATAIPPTPTVAPPTVLLDLLTNVQVIKTDSFDNLNNWDKWNPGTGNISNGMFELQGQADYLSGLVFKQRLSDGNGIVLKYKTAKIADFQSEFVFATGEYETDSWRTFGVYNGKRPKADLYQGRNGIGFNNLNGNFLLKADTWYNLLMAIGKNGEFLAVIWNPADTSQQIFYHERIGEKWMGLNWEFQAKANIGETMYIDDLLLFTFNEIK
jgi:hypothetical protein